MSAELPPLPTPARLRLVAADRTLASRVRPPLGLRAFSDEDDADVALVLRRTDAPPAPDEIAGQVPPPAQLRGGTLLVVLPELAPAATLLGRLFSPRVLVSRAARSSALLAVGYTRLGGGVDAKGRDLAWGYAPPRT